MNQSFDVWMSPLCQGRKQVLPGGAFWLAMACRPEILKLPTGNEGDDVRVELLSWGIWNDAGWDGGRVNRNDICTRGKKLIHRHDGLKGRSVASGMHAQKDNKVPNRDFCTSAVISLTQDWWVSWTPIRFVCMQGILYKKKNQHKIISIQAVVIHETCSCEPCFAFTNQKRLSAFLPPTFCAVCGNFWCSCTASQSPIISLRLYCFVAAPQIEFSHQPCPFCLHAVWPSTPTPTAWWNWIVTFRFAWAHIPLPARSNLQKLSPALSRGQRVTLVPEDSFSPRYFFSYVNKPS